MKRLTLFLLLTLAAASALALGPDTALLTQVSDDAHAIERLAQVSKRGELPRDLVRRIVNEDIDQLRGKRSDGTFLYATFERAEAGRVQNSFSVQATSEGKLVKMELKGDFVYRMLLEVPSRRMLVTRNKHVYVERIELEYIPQNSSAPKIQSIPVQAWLEPGASRLFDLDEVGRQATARILARADKEEGYANLEVTLLKARVVDNADSPYAAVMANERALLKALDADDNASIRNVAARLHEDLGRQTPLVAMAGGSRPEPAPAARTIEVIAPRTPEPAPSASSGAALATGGATANPDLYIELLAIEDLLTGSESERREGNDRLHQLLRKLRPR